MCVTVSIVPTCTVEKDAERSLHAIFSRSQVDPGGAW